MIRVGLDVHDSILGLRPEASRALAHRAAEAGLDFLVVADHVSFRGGQGFDGMVSAALALAALGVVGVTYGLSQSESAGSLMASAVLIPVLPTPSGPISGCRATISPGWPGWITILTPGDNPA